MSKYNEILSQVRTADLNLKMLLDEMSKMRASYNIAAAGGEAVLEESAVCTVVKVHRWNRSREIGDDPLVVLQKKKIMARTFSNQSIIAQKTWEMSNKMEVIGDCDEIFKFDKKQNQNILNSKPWEDDPHFFKDIKISALALLKMLMHARSGKTNEVMGVLIGKVLANVMVVMDSFALPVEGTETRVNAQDEAYEYIHPGYGCWLSGIDVSTQILNQNYQDPFVAIVIDPVQTISAGKVCLGAFRTYPKVRRQKVI
ncbi:hypothetical protein M0802_010650 [Mischocyttarus mexicanus]|nr:hypothetical protein M0802_010650 [Mischocyttarus mexicanus]